MKKSRFLLAIIFLVLSVASCYADAPVITGSYTIEYNGTTYRAVDDECIYYVDLNAHNADHPGVPLPDLKKTVADNYDSDAVPVPVVVTLTDYVDCTGTSHNFQEANICPHSQHPNKPSRLMNISGKQFRVTAAPDAGFATYYYSYDVDTSGQAGVAHLLVAESSNDQERYTTLAIHHPDDIIYSPGLPWSPPYTYKPENPSELEPTNNPWGDPWYHHNTIATQQGPVFGPDVALTVYTGREFPIDHKPFNIHMHFYAKTTKTRVVVSSLGCNLHRGPNDGGAVSRMWVFSFAGEVSDSYPTLMLPEEPSERRQIGIHMPHPWYFYAHYGTPVRTLAHRQENLQKLVEDLKFSGFDYIVFNAINGSDRTGKAWYPGSEYFDWNIAGDLLSELLPIAEAEDIKVVPLITALKDPGGLSSVSYQMNTNGSFTRAFGNPTLDPLRPEVQQIVFDVLEEIATRSASNPAIKGIGIRANGKIGTCYTAHEDGWRGAKQSGYSTWNLQQFKNDTGSAVPTSPPSAAYDWLQARPDEWEAWINWRCEKTREFWLACRDLIRSHGSDLIFYVQTDLPSETPGTNIEWPDETPYDLLRHHGYDPNMFVDDTGIVIARGMMVAQDRFYVRSRWGEPWGSNHDRMKLFHFAPGVAEMYQTAEGRACDFYQNYWEEHQHPYWEFGSCGSHGVYFRTSTPAAPERFFFEGATMAMRRQDPDTMTWLGWVRPTLGHEARLRKFSQAFRALPVVDPVPFAGTVDPAMDEVVARWYRDRLAVINDTNTARNITLSFSEPVPVGSELIDIVTGRRLVSASQLERQNVSFDAEAYSLNTFLLVEATEPRADFTTGPLPTGPPLTVQFHDASVATDITSREWDFGDGSPHGSGQNPTHTYGDYGTYNVTLTIIHSEGTSQTTKPITLSPVPPAVETVSPSRGSTISHLSTVGVTFSKAVAGVTAGDLIVNGCAATSVSGSGDGPYAFSGFASPESGTANVSLDSGDIQDAGGTPFAGEQWTYTITPPPTPGVRNPSFEENGGSYIGWEIKHISGEWPDDPPLNNSNPWGVTTPFGNHFGGKITNGLGLDFYLGQVVGVTDWNPHVSRADWQLSTWVQLRSTHNNQPNPTGVHHVWEIGWNDDGSEPAGIMDCDNYQVVASIDGTYTGNDHSFHLLEADGKILEVADGLWQDGLRGVAFRVRMFNDTGWWWTLTNTDNVFFEIVARDDMRIGQAKRLPDGSTVAFCDKMATAEFGDVFYMQESDLSAGIQVQKPGHGIIVGAYTDVTGIIRTNSDGERYIEASSVSQHDFGTVSPLLMANRGLGGTDWDHDVNLGSGQIGVVGGTGLNNIGLLVTTWGRVTSVGADYLYIDDGSGLMDGTTTGGTTNVGVRVICDPAGYSVGDFLLVTGVSSCFETPSGQIARRILTRDVDDVQGM